MILNKFPGIKALILDMDGVLWRDTQAIGDLPAIFDKVKRLDLQLLLATNNATRSIDEHMLKLNGFGVNVDKSQVINSAQAVAVYLSKRFPQKGDVYVVGEPGLKSTLSDNGFIHAESCTPDTALAVIASLDYSFTYEKLKKATLLVRSGLPVIGTNPDTTYPTPQGQTPGSGTIIKAIETSSEVQAVIIGKPQPLLYSIALDKLGTEPQETLAVGDRLETDIAGAQAAGCLTALVLSGVSTLDQAKQWYPQPDVICQDLEELIQ